MNNFEIYNLKRKKKIVYPRTWLDVRTLVRTGKHFDVFAIGDQVVCNRNGTPIVWDVIGIDHDTPTDPQYRHSLTLQTHDCVAELQYDAAEALYSQTEILPAGTYHFNVVSQTWFAGDVGKTFQFTLNNDVPAGGQLILSGTYNATLDGKTIKVYSSGASTSVLETASLSEGADGDPIGSFGNAVNGNFNSVHRVFFGSNNYKESALRQWLRSDKAAGSVWTPQTKWDRPPSWAANTAGFINGFDSDFLNVVGKTHIVCSRASSFEGGSNKDEMDDKFFLISRREGYAGNELASVIEGEPYPYYSSYSDLNAPGGGVDKNRIKYRNGVAKIWWTRSPYTGNGYSVRNFYTSGALYNYYAYHAYGVAPACNIV